MSYQQSTSLLLQAWAPIVSQSRGRYNDYRCWMEDHNDTPQVNWCCDAHVVASMIDLMRADDSMTLYAVSNERSTVH